MREFVDPFPLDGAIFLRLQNAGGPVGRALAALVDRSEYLVGTSNFPIDIMGNYKSYQYNFHEIGSLLDLENSREAQNRFAPIPTSLTRSELLRSQEAPDNTPVFVLYLYHVVSCIRYRHNQFPYLLAADKGYGGFHGPHIGHNPIGPHCPSRCAFECHLVHPSHS